jgi:hypothetical protein
LHTLQGDEAMMTSFSTLYAGQVLEGEGIGFDGIPRDDRWYDNDRLAQAFDIAKDTTVMMDELGYDTL